MSSNRGIFLIPVFNPKLLNNPLALCSLINLDFLLSHTADFNKSVSFLLCFANFGFLFFLHFKQYDKIVL